MKSLLAQLGAVCQRCETWTPPGMSPCGGCGAELPVVAWLHGTSQRVEVATASATPEVGCRRCGTPHPSGLRFCPGCGARLAGGAPRSLRTPPALHPGEVRLLLLRGLGAAGTPCPLLAEQTTVGRSNCDLSFPTDHTVPPHAATLLFREGRLYVRDEGAGSVFVRLRLPEVLRPGALFAIGDQLLRFSGRVVAPAPQPGRVLPYGSPVPADGALLRLERIHLGGVVGSAWVRQAPVQLGRTVGQIHFPEDPFVSARHLELDVDPAGATLRDLGSSNGTFVQVPADGERELALGDTLRIGRNILRLEEG